MFPAFVNCTTIDWFSEWPNDALLEVAEKYLEAMDLGDEEVMQVCGARSTLSKTIKLCWESFVGLCVPCIAEVALPSGV